MAMAQAELRFWCWLITLLFWAVAFVHFLRAAPYLRSKKPDQTIEYNARICQSYWCFIRGSIIMLVGYALTFREPREDWTHVGLIVGGMVVIALLWQHARRDGQRLLEKRDEDLNGRIPDPPR